MLAEIADFDFKTVLKPSNRMVITDCLSRQFTHEPSPTVNVITGKELKNLQENELTLTEIGRYATLNRWPNLRSKKLEIYYKNRHQITTGPNGELGIDDGSFKVFPPTFLIEDILKENHDNCGHPGVSQTSEKISRKYFIPDLKNLVINYVRSCDRCQRIKPCTNPLNAPFSHVKPPSQPFERFAIDLEGPLPITNRHNKYICVSTDLFSKKIYAQPIKTKRPEEVLGAAMSDWLRNPTLPQSVLMDNGGEFVNLRKFCEEKGSLPFTSISA